MPETLGPQISIVLADDHTLVRQALRLLLASEPSFVVLGEAADGRLALDLAIDLMPDVLVVDLMMPALGGIEVARQLARRAGSTRVLVLSMSISEAHVLEALAAGAHGYVRKDATAGDLITAIREVAAGRRYLSPPYSDRAIGAYVERAAMAADDPYDHLTTREREVLHLAAEGYGNSDVASRLGISPRTAETHRASLRRKLGLADQTAIVRYALERGILPFDPSASARPLGPPSEPDLRAWRPRTKG